MQACSRRPRRSATRRCGSIPATISSARAPAFSSLWAVRSGDGLCRDWMQDRSGRITSGCPSAATGKNERGMERLRQLPDSTFFHTRALQACYSTPRPPGSEQLLEQFEKEIFTYRDPEPRYMQAGLFNPCLGKDFTARLVKSAIDGGFCAYDYLQTRSAIDFSQSTGISDCARRGQAMPGPLLGRTRTTLEPTSWPIPKRVVLNDVLNESRSVFRIARR